MTCSRGWGGGERAAGADPNVLNKQHATPCHLAAANTKPPAPAAKPSAQQPTRQAKPALEAPAPLSPEGGVAAVADEESAAEAEAPEPEPEPEDPFVETMGCLLGTGLVDLEMANSVR